jgi:hypothetical protein
MLPTLVANENVPASAVKALRDAGFDVLAIEESHRTVSNRAVIALACEARRWLATFDRDYAEFASSARASARARIETLFSGSASSFAMEEAVVPFDGRLWVAPIPCLCQ